MTTFVPFLPSQTTPFSFVATLDNEEYTVVVRPWNLLGQRWYVGIYAVDNALVAALPLIGSPLPKMLGVTFGSRTGGTLKLLTIEGGAIYNVFAGDTEMFNAFRFKENTIVIPPGPLALVSLSWAGGLATATSSVPLGFPKRSVVELTISGAVPADYNGDFDCTVTGEFTFTYPLPSDPGGPATVPGVFYPTGPITAIRWNLGVVTATTLEPLLYPIGSVVMLTIAGVVPAGFNGRFACVIRDRYTFSYSLPADPGPPPSVSGTFSPDISMTAGYFSSTLIYRPATGNFEVTP